MQHHVLSEGTILDERYRIDSLLGEGGFGITYAARNIRLDLKVAIKELFWRDHSTRDASVSPEVALRREEDEAIFRQQKDRFLREARTIRDFSNQSGIAHVMDYFEANNTAYIVMEYVEGQTLGDRIAERGPIPALELFERFLPLVESLSYVHKSGVIHRDISPDNIMVQPDGSLKLIDFGAAREYVTIGDASYSVITKDSYAPSEQYDRNGKQGPWTDVYSLCATLYTCLTGIPPLSAVQRMFLDELKPPSELKPGIDPKCEAVLLRGLELNAAKRWQSMDELADAMRKALPAPPSPPAPPRPWLYALLALLVAAIAAIGILWWTNRDRPKFDCVTETFRLTAPSAMSVKEFAQAQEELNEALDDFAGEDNYIVTTSGSNLLVELPLDLFEGRDIGAGINDALGDLLSAHKFTYFYQTQADWENPASSMFAGENQVGPESFSEQTAVFTYSTYDKMSAGQRASAFIDMKVRLDALGAPYAVGTAYGNPDQFVFRIDPGRVNRYILDTIGEKSLLYLGGEGLSDILNVSTDAPSFSIADCGDGSYCLRYEPSNQYAAEAIQKFTESVLKQGQSKLYLQSYDSVPFAQIELDSPIADGVLEFRDFMFDGAEKIDEAHRYLLDYFVAFACDTELPSSFALYGEGMWDAERGDVLFDLSLDDYLGPASLFKEQETQLRSALIRVNQETEYSCIYSDREYYIDLALPQDDDLIEGVDQAIDALFRVYSICGYCTDRTILIYLCDEQDGQRYRVFLYTKHDPDRDELYHYAELYIANYGSNEPPPYAEQLQAWWDGLPLEDYGIERQIRGLEW